MTIKIKIFQIRNNSLITYLLGLRFCRIGILHPVNFEVVVSFVVRISSEKISESWI